jgi:hypothetical protein
MDENINFNFCLQDATILVQKENFKSKRDYWKKNI